MDRDEIISAVSRVETKVDLLLAREERNDTRLRSVEKKMWIHTGVWAVLAVIAGKLGFPVPSPSL